jgi:NADP-dependent 3-hydroxy acid dehydrogenase YdfG
VNEVVMRDAGGLKYGKDPKLAVITGASGGMGMACARQLGRRFRFAELEAELAAAHADISARDISIDTLRVQLAA